MTTELDLIEWIAAQSQDLPAGVRIAIGDDCAVFEGRSSCCHAITTDVLVEDVHFRRRWISPYFLGRKSLLVNLSDLAAVAAEPYACLLALSIPAQLREDYFRAFMAGFLEEAERWKCPLIGGDLSRSPAVHVSVTALGTLEGEGAIQRSTARAGDQIVVVGEVGLSRLGLDFLGEEDPSGLEGLDSEDALAGRFTDPFRLQCVRAHYLPIPQIGPAVWLRQNALATAMIDVSDGLATDLLRLARASRVQAVVRAAALPLLESAISETIGLDVSINGGEDYALLFTVSPGQMIRLRESYPPGFPPYRIIGELREGRPAFLIEGEFGLRGHEPEGFDHFK